MYVYSHYVSREKLVRPVDFLLKPKFVKSSLKEQGLTTVEPFAINV